MEARFLARSEAKDVIVALANESQTMDWAVAWARPPNEVLRSAYKHEEKFNRLIIGTHFHQTAPSVLRHFEPNSSVRMMLPSGDTFHPKIYLFQIDQETAVVVGSHNLTPKAFDGNSEMSILLRGNASDPKFKAIKDFLDAEWLRSVDISEHIDAYEIQHEAKQVHVKALEIFEKNVRRPSKNSTKPSPFDLTWPKFVKEVKKDRHGIATRIDLLRSAQFLFDTSTSLSHMKKLERKAIGGTYRKNEVELDDKPWGWFGTMGGNSAFRGR